MTPVVTIVPVGETALSVAFGDDIDLALNERVLAFDRSLSTTPIEGVLEVVPALANLLVRFDPGVVTHGVLEQELRTRIENRGGEPTRGGRLWRLPAVYGGVHGPDLTAVAAMRSASEDETIAAHAATTFRVMMLGFAPGFAYLGVADETWDLARKTAVTPLVPAGSILVAVRQSAVSGTATPTGWHCIGRVPGRTFDPHGDRPSLFEPGDQVVFEPVASAEFESYSAAGAIEPPDG